LGDVNGSVAAARESVTYADHSGEWDQKVKRRTTLAEALHQSGRWEEAEGLFREAEEIQRTSQPGFHFLYSLQGFRFCDLLLGRGKYQEVIERAGKALEIAKENKWLLEMALDRLILGRAWLEHARQDHGSDPRAEPWTRARHFLDRAVTGLREAQRQDYLPRSLIARSSCSRLRGDFENAWADLSEVLEIAESGDMKLHLCDFHLEAARLCIAEGKKTEAAEHSRKAEELIEETGYFRRRTGGDINCPDP
jgi:tetratricopeptide (TPR) repeat protein